MAHLNPTRLHVNFIQGVEVDSPLSPRAYTLTHSDKTGDLFLSIGRTFNKIQIAGIYTRLMRDEVLAEWELADQVLLRVHCHVSGGFVFGPAGWRESIFRYHMPMVLEAFRYGDRLWITSHAEVAEASVLVIYHAKTQKLTKIENWGKFI